MSELSLELYQWEDDAFQRSRYKRKKAINHLTIDVTDPENPVIAAPIDVIRRLADSLALPNFVELPGGYARTYYSDSVPHMAKIMVNNILAKIWRKGK